MIIDNEIDFKSISQHSPELLYTFYGNMQVGSEKNSRVIYQTRKS